MVPPLPKITGDVDIILDVYSHESLKMGDERNIDYGDTGRLIELGEKAIQMALTFHFFNKRPMLDVEEIQAKASIATVLSDENLREWLTAYNIKSKYKVAPNTVDILNSPEEMRKFFKSYAGALQHRNGLNHVISWITALVDPDAQPNSLVKAMSPSSVSEDHDSPVAPDSPAPPLPNSPASQTAPKAVEGNFSLLIFNQTASQKGIKVTYPAVQLSGPSHQPLWKVTCCLDGVPQGEGTGRSQKQAKEEAGRQASAKLGW